MSLTILCPLPIVLADSRKSLGVQVSKTIYSLFIQEIFLCVHMCVSLTREKNNSSFYCICFHPLSVLNVWRRLISKCYCKETEIPMLEIELNILPHILERLFGFIRLSQDIRSSDLDQGLRSTVLEICNPRFLVRFRGFHIGQVLFCQMTKQTSLSKDLMFSSFIHLRFFMLKLDL